MPYLSLSYRSSVYWALHCRFKRWAGVFDGVIPRTIQLVTPMEEIVWTRAWWTALAVRTSRSSLYLAPRPCQTASDRPYAGYFRPRQPQRPLRRMAKLICSNKCKPKDNSTVFTSQNFKIILSNHKECGSRSLTHIEWNCRTIFLRLRALYSDKVIIIIPH